MCKRGRDSLDESGGLRYNSAATRAGAVPARLIEGALIPPPGKGGRLGGNEWLNRQSRSN